MAEKQISLLLFERTRKMKKKRGFTLIELLVVIAIIAMLLAILMPALNKVKKIAQRVVCGTNLKGLGTAQVVYANDYEDMYVQANYLDGPKTITNATAEFQVAAKDWSLANELSLGASLYLLVREADVSPKSFICGAGGQTAYDGKNANNLDITELWDFGNPNYDASTGPVQCQSYSYHNPYSNFAADGTRSAAFAVMADRSPWYDAKLASNTVTPITVDNWIDGVWLMAPYYDASLNKEKWEYNRANAQPHGREGQNVMFGDGHSAFERTSDVGVKHDNIYTPRNGALELNVRQGGVPLDAYPMDVPVGSSDSVLINDF